MNWKDKNVFVMKHTVGLFVNAMPVLPIPVFMFNLATSI